MHMYAMDREDRFQSLLACLSEPSRYRVLRVIAEGDRCVSEIAAQVGLSQSCTTRHLQALQRAGVLSRFRDGKRVLFRIEATDPGRTRILEWVLLRGEPGHAAGGAARADEPAEPAEAPPTRAPIHRSVTSRMPVSLRRISRERPQVPREAAVTPAGATAPVRSGSVRDPETPRAADPPFVPDELEDYLL